MDLEMFVLTDNQKGQKIISVLKAALTVHVISNFTMENKYRKTGETVSHEGCRSHGSFGQVTRRPQDSLKNRELALNQFQVHIQDGDTPYYIRAAGGAEMWRRRSQLDFRWRLAR